MEMVLIAHLKFVDPALLILLQKYKLHAIINKHVHLPLEIHILLIHVQEFNLILVLVLIDSQTFKSQI